MAMANTHYYDDHSGKLDKFSDSLRMRNPNKAASGGASVMISSQTWNR